MVQSTFYLCPLFLTIYKHILDSHSMSYILGATGQTGAYFGPGSGPIHFDYVVCSGTEYNLTDCQVTKGTRQSSHSEDVGVKCQTSKDVLYKMSTHSCNKA